MGPTMTPEDQRTVYSLIDKLKSASVEERERVSADLKTAVMLASDPEVSWVEPVIISQGGRFYRAFPINS